MPAPPRSRVRRAVLAAATLAGLAGLCAAQSAPTVPTDASTSPAAARAAVAPVLTLGGRVQAAGGVVRLTLQDLDRLPQHRFTTATPWYRQPVDFAGPRLRDVLALAGASGTQLRARALNDYTVVIPVEDARRWDVIVATRIDGRPIAVRDKGPFFVVYPFDTSGELRQARYYERSIWQLALLEVE